jgi:hypothetical protein
MSRRCNCHDNAVTESFFSSLNKELVHHSFKTRDEARTAIFEYMEVFYNRQCRYQSLDYVSPLSMNGSSLLLNLLSVKWGLAHCDLVFGILHELELGNVDVFTAPSIAEVRIFSRRCPSSLSA